MAKGYISIHRKIWDSDVWDNNEPFDKRSAWIDLVLMANHKDKKMIYGMKAKVIKRGQLHTSIRNLAKRWRWTNSRTERYINLLKNLEMIQTDGGANGTTITLVNYDFYQNQRYTNEDTNKDTREDTREDTNRYTNGGQTIMNNKNNNVTNNEKKGSSTILKNTGGWERYL